MTSVSYNTINFKAHTSSVEFADKQVFQLRK